MPVTAAVAVAVPVTAAPLLHLLGLAEEPPGRGTEEDRSTGRTVGLGQQGQQTDSRMDGKHGEIGGTVEPRDGEQGPAGLVETAIYRDRNMFAHIDLG